MPSLNGEQFASRIARRNILELEPYRCARDDYSSGILLDANENSFGAPISDSQNEVVVLERYPDPYQISLKEKICAYRKGFGLKPENIFVGVGSDEAIDLLIRIFCVPGEDTILVTPPTYGMYKVCAKINDVGVVNVPLTPDFDLCIDEVVAAITPNVKLIFLCSPGNPTSKALPVEDIQKIISHKWTQSTLVVIDEAYVDFSMKGSGLSLIEGYPNVVVLQTLSKAFGMAAIRCGFCFGPSDIIQLMNNVKAPYNINSKTSQMAQLALDNADKVASNINSLLEQRQYLQCSLEQLSFVKKVFPSDSNFLLFRLAGSHAKEVYKAMADKGVVTRYRGSEIHCEECIRVTIGKPHENDAFLVALKEAYHLFES